MHLLKMNLNSREIDGALVTDTGIPVGFRTVPMMVK